MFEIVLAAVFAAILAQFLYLLKQVFVLQQKVNRVLKVAGPEEYEDSSTGMQRELVQSFNVFDSLLASLQSTRYTAGTLSNTARAFISTFRERAAAYVERGCEGSLLCTQVREDKLKRLAVQLLKQCEEEFTFRESINFDALDNGDFAEYLKIVEYLVHRYLIQINKAEGERSTVPGLLRPMTV